MTRIRHIKDRGWAEFDRAGKRMTIFQPTEIAAETGRAIRLSVENGRKRAGYRSNCAALDRRDVAQPACGHDSGQMVALADAKFKGGA